MNDDSKKGAWFKWIAGTIIALIGAGGGLIAVLQYLDSRNEAADREYRQALANWRSFSPQSISRGPQSAEIRGGDRFDLETGLATSNPGQSSAWDLLFACLSLPFIRPT